MALSPSGQKACFFMFAGLLVLTLLSACGGNTSASTTTSASTGTPVSAAMATATALKSLMTLVGEPKAKMLAGTTFEVDGKVKNGDSKQHDIFLEVTLLDTTGKKIASTIQNVDNVAGGATVSYVIQGTTLQPRWAKVQVTVQKVTENTGDAGTD